MPRSTRQSRGSCTCRTWPRLRVHPRRRLLRPALLSADLRRGDRRDQWIHCCHRSRSREDHPGRSAHFAASPNDHGVHQDRVRAFNDPGRRSLRAGAAIGGEGRLDGAQGEHDQRGASPGCREDPGPGAQRGAVRSTSRRCAEQAGQAGHSARLGHGSAVRSARSAVSRRSCTSGTMVARFAKCSMPPRLVAGT